MTYFRSGKFDFPVPLSIALRSAEYIPTFTTGNIRDKMEETTSTYMKEHTYQPTTPFRPKQTRREIGLFSGRGTTFNENTKNNVVKRKYAEINVSVFATEEIHFQNE